MLSTDLHLCSTGWAVIGWVKSHDQCSKICKWVFMWSLWLFNIYKYFAITCPYVAHEYNMRRSIHELYVWDDDLFWGFVFFVFFHTFCFSWSTIQIYNRESVDYNRNFIILFTGTIVAIQSKSILHARGVTFCTNKQPYNIKNNYTDVHCTPI